MSLSNCGHFVFIPSSKVLITSPKTDHTRYPEKHKYVPQNVGWFHSM